MKRTLTTKTMATKKDKTNKKRSGQPLQEGAIVSPNGEGVDLEGFTRKTRPPFIRPLSLPVGAIVMGKIEKVNVNQVKRGKKMVDSKSLLLATQAGQISFPLSSVIESALDEKPEDFIGQTIAIKVLPPRKSSTFKKEYFNAEVFVKE